MGVWALKSCGPWDSPVLSHRGRGARLRPAFPRHRTCQVAAGVTLVASTHGPHGPALPSAAEPAALPGRGRPASRRRRALPHGGPPLLAELWGVIRLSPAPRRAQSGQPDSRGAFAGAQVCGEGLPVGGACCRVWGPWWRVWSCPPGGMGGRLRGLRPRPAPCALPRGLWAGGSLCGAVSG